MRVFVLFLFFLIANCGFTQEICDNGIDDNGNGLIDLQDTTDCSCEYSGDTTVSSLVPNASFENRSCCPSNAAQLNCADDWIQASVSTSDYFNTCGFTNFPLGQTVIPPMPMPSGNGYVGYTNGVTGQGANYKEYIGACLLDTMRAGITYQIQFYLAQGTGSLNFDVAIYGTTDCTNLPFGTASTTFGCPANDPLWEAIDSTPVSLSTTSWTLVTMTFTPSQNYTAIAIGGSCTQVSGTHYYYMDDLVLNTLSSFNVSAPDILTSGSYCQGNLELKADFDSIPNSFQWYKDSIALVGEVDSIYPISQGEIGAYQVRMVYDSGCVISSVYLLDTAIVDFDLDTILDCAAGFNTIEALNARGGMAPYEYQLNSGLFVTDSIFDSLVGATYTVTVRDANLCAKTKTITTSTVLNSTPLFYADTVCFGDSTTITDTSSGAVLTVLWDFGDGSSSTINNAIKKHLYASPGSYTVKLKTTASQGCSDSLSVQVEVLDIPKADFSFTNVCQFDTVQFVNTTMLASGGATTGLSWDWMLDGVSVSSLKDSAIDFPLSGFYNIKLTATTPYGCLSDTTQQIEIYVKPQALFYADTVCFGDSTKFTDTSLGPISTVLWDFGDGNSSGLNSSVSKNWYASPGAYTVQLKTTTAQGCQDSLSMQVEVLDMPTVNFNYANVCKLDSAQFVNTTTLASGATTTGLNWDWKVDGVFFSSSKDFSNVYTLSGFYDVTLSAASPEGCSHDTTQEIEVYQKPQALFYADTVCFGDSTTLINQSLGTLSDVLWSFGDGDTTTQNLATTIHTYVSPGVYSVQLRAETAEGCLDSLSVQVKVNDMPSANFTPVNTCQFDTVEYLNTTTLASGGATAGLSWIWMLDSVNASNLKDFEKTFALPGLYNVSLTATSSEGCVSDTTKEVQVYEKPQALFYADTVCLGTSSTLTSVSTGPITTVLWQFGDGDTTTQLGGVIQHQYANAGLYTVGLNVSTAQGCFDSSDVQVLVGDVPIANFSFSDTCQFENIQLTNLTTIGGSTNTAGILWNWDLGNTITSTIKNPVTTYLNSGIIDVVLTATSPLGCVGDTTKKMEIHPKPQANFEADTVCFGDSTHLIDLSSVVTGNITSWIYETDGVVYTNQNSIHQYGSDGIFSATLIVATNNFCRDTITKPVLIHSLPIADFSFAPDLLNVFDTYACFTDLSTDASVYFWDFGFSEPNSILSNPCVMFPKEIVASYMVNLKIENQFGCIDSIQKEIVVEDDFSIFVPNTFTPNGDGKNDMFVPVLNGAIEIEFYVFDRWGTELFYTNRINKGWDGTYKSSEPAQQDTYVYRIIVKNFKQQKRIYIGHVNLVK